MNDTNLILISEKESSHFKINNARKYNKYPGTNQNGSNFSISLKNYFTVNKQPEDLGSLSVINDVYVLLFSTVINPITSWLKGRQRGWVNA